MLFCFLMLKVLQSKPSFIAVAEATPLFNILSNSTVKESGVLIVGPEGGT